MMNLAGAKLRRIDEVSSSVTYLGYSVMGVVDADANWRILRLNTSGTVTAIEYAEGTNDFSFVWDDRASYTYS